MGRTEDIDHLRSILHKRRRDILETSLGARRELRSLQASDRTAEYEENAQTELADYTLSSLLESQRREIILIDAALRRMESGAFGLCVDCDAEIPYERLEALPFAIRCEEDARRHERERRGAHGGAATL